MQQPFLILNWKMNPQTLSEAKALKAETQRQAKRWVGKVVIAAPAVFLGDLANSKGVLSYAAQNIHEEALGSHTGDISATQVKTAGAQYVIIGHAERRALDDTDERIKRKVAAALGAGLCPILCIGEKQRDEHGAYLEVVRTQIQKAMEDVSKQGFKKVIIAYEPVWAIGAEKPMSTHEMHEMSIFIRKVLNELYGKQGFVVPVLYGGSIDGGSAAAMLQHGDVQGLLVGRAGTEKESLRALFKTVQGI